MRTEPFTVQAVWPPGLDLEQVCGQLVTAVISFHTAGPIAAVAGILPPGMGPRMLLLVVYTPEMIDAEELGTLLDDSVLSAVHAVDETLDLGCVQPVLIAPVQLAGVTLQGAASIEAIFPRCAALEWGGSAELLPVGLSATRARRPVPVTRGDTVM
ncbi:hypothetical protein C8D87_11468 [Lentzea atacamensis]|uniref:Uncharacterized protein n=1 Tax=Lentzea atacamensis TaxID=531938 RepID=A0ABX9DVZ1_9PSEU|nr:hypothetical protein [Lentzea atacamensis]RAS59456.1 hypothetical protein C8D87_11468 [Lentzea atacamensis]